MVDKDVIGVWQLRSRVDVDAAGERRVDPGLGADPLGMLCFSSDRFAAQFMRRDRTSVSGAPRAVTGANNTGAVDGYDAYFGTYTLDVASGLLKVRLEGAISPAHIGHEFERRVRVNSEHLAIELDTTSADGTPVTRTLTFSRLR